eukprot:CAMPEP_0184692808 /NCGR_PEP_ID=MMETSP0313-20130426/1118_1 /TAXON_ID=2792 /ORGANISM="Porphyridium aerugineum, Strain SAG 1380-2" /LENGTH=796 /DNA_ID=CAMNT_0027150663 /DNA_START=183 /DNA_END=2573 /DNA_ORIENTATION=-
MPPNHTNVANPTNAATTTASAAMDNESTKVPPRPAFVSKIRNPYLEMGLEDVVEDEQEQVANQGRDITLGPYARNRTEQDEDDEPELEHEYEHEHEHEEEMGMLMLGPNVSHTHGIKHSNTQASLTNNGTHVANPSMKGLFLREIEADGESAERQDVMGYLSYDPSLPRTRNPYFDRMDGIEEVEEEVGEKVMIDSGKNKSFGKVSSGNGKDRKEVRRVFVNPYLSGVISGSKADAGPSKSFTPHEKPEEPEEPEEPELKVKLSLSGVDSRQVERPSVRRMVHFKDDEEDQTPKQKPQHREVSFELSSCTVNTPSPLGDNASNDPRHPDDVYSMGKREQTPAMDWDNMKTESVDPKKRKRDDADASQSAAKIVRPESPDFVMVDVTFAPKNKERADPPKSFSRSPKPSPKPKASSSSISRTRSTGSPPTPLNARPNELGPCPIITTPGWKKLPVSSHSQNRLSSTTVDASNVQIEPKHSGLLLDPSLITDMSIMEPIMDPEDWWFLQRHQKLSEEERPSSQQPALSRSSIVSTPKPGPVLGPGSGPGSGPGPEPSPRRGRPKLSSPKNNPVLQTGFLPPLEAARRVMHVLYTYEICSTGRPGLGLNEEQKARLSQIRSALQAAKPSMPGSSDDLLKSQCEDDQEKVKSPAEMLDDKFASFQNLADSLFDSFVDAIKDGRKLNKRSAEQDPQLSVFLKVAIDEVSTAVLRARKRCTEAMRHQLDIEKLNLLQSEEQEQQERLFAATQSQELRIAMLKSYGKVRNGLQERSSGQTTVPAGYHVDGILDDSSLDIFHDV